ncbi:unnamed protein product [Adineta ricciae]|uniref:Uncharacterized protein n=1 Tax=Adineta ricciae TaxID=249248 RepID=A0A816A564_ADIRI|nr:unnamed protein product [Adineta ricciae]CAF1591232.1 unnamed protein product [Adineta ricciae]
MLLVKFFLFIIYLITIIKSQNECLENSIFTCYCEYNGGTTSASCTQNVPSNETSIDWSTFSLIPLQRHKFNFNNFLRLTPSTFTNFTSKFSGLDHLEFIFTDGIDEIEENTFESFQIYSDTWIYLTFLSPRNFRLANNVFSQIKYQELIIDNIQYNDIFHLPYQLNINAFDKTVISKVSIRNSNEIQLISNESSSFQWEDVEITECSLSNVDLLIESLTSNSLRTLDLSLNKLNSISSLIKFTKLTILNLNNNLIKEIQSNIFTNLINLFEIDLSYNEIKHISSDAFIGLVNLNVLKLNNNHLNSLETVNIHNEIESFLSPLNETLPTLILSNNFLQNINSIQNLSSLMSLEVCCNQIKKLDEFIFKETHELQSVDLSFNHIESIHPLTFNGTIIEYLDLSSNPFISLEITNIIYDEQFKPKNQTTSFLDSIKSRLISLSLANCTNLQEINWFVLSKLEKLTYLDLSGITKTDQFWTYNTRDDTHIYWYGHFSKLQIIFNNIQFNNDDYCFSKSIFQIFNETVLHFDDDHPCNCFLFLVKKLIFPTYYPTCLTNQSIIDELTQQCMNIDSYCLSLITTTTTTTTLSSSNTSFLTLTTILTSIPITTASELSSASTTTTTTQIIQSSTSTTTTTTQIIQSSTSTTTTTTQIIQSSTSTRRITTTNIVTTLRVETNNGKWKTILAIMIPSVFILIILSLIGIYIMNRRQKNKSNEIIEMDRVFVNPFVKK